jgi:hypothetical protein
MILVYVRVTDGESAAVGRTGRLALPTNTIGRAGAQDIQERDAEAGR